MRATAIALSALSALMGVLHVIALLEWAET